jgi:thiol:disulfide interchange protein DsbC
MIRRTLLCLALATSLGACAAEPAAPAAAAPAAPGSASAATPGAPASGEEAIRAALKTIAPDSEIGRIGPSPITGFSEVALGSRIVYVSQDGKLLIQGALFDIAARENLTSASEAVIRQGLLAKISPEQGVLFAAANPRHTITVFTDIDCGYCRKMHEHMAEYNRLGISVNYLFFPRTGPSGESYEKAVSVWCAPDRQVAMTQAKAGRALPRGNCANPVTRDFDLGSQMGVDGTPAVFAANGAQLGGYLTPEDLLSRLEALKPTPAK